MNIEEVWSEYKSGLKAFLHFKVGNIDDVDDLLQELLIKTHNNLHTINSETSIRPWLYTVANNTITDFYRAKGKSNEMIVDVLPDMEDKQASDIHQSLSQCIEPFIRILAPETADKDSSTHRLNRRSPCMELFYLAFNIQNVYAQSIQVHNQIVISIANIFIKVKGCLVGV